MRTIPFLRIVPQLLLIFFLQINFVYAGWPFSHEPKGPSAKELYSQATALKEKQDWIGAKKIYDEILQDQPDFDDIEEVQAEVEKINIRLITSPIESDDTVVYTIRKGDSLDKIAKKFSTTVELLLKRNRLKTNKIIAGDKLSVWKSPFSILIDKSQNILILKNGELRVKIYSVSTGKAAKTTPTGEFTIVLRMMNPVWFHHGVVVPSGAPENFLGTRWLGFNKAQYGIHGTIEPQLIGQSVSSGCVRMRNEDVEELYDFIAVGTKVKIVE